LTGNCAPILEPVRETIGGEDRESCKKVFGREDFEYEIDEQIAFDDSFEENPIDDVRSHFFFFENDRIIL
jgi:hypothetical protein